MSDLVSPDEIESIVGIRRHPTIHFARIIPAMDRVYLLHSKQCLDSGIDLRDCHYSRALDMGVTARTPWTYWQRVPDRPVPVKVQQGYVLPDLMALRVAGTRPWKEDE